MKLRLNAHNFKQLDILKKHLEERFPGLVIGFYLKNFSSSSMATTLMAVSATFEAHGSDLVWRIYRKSDTPEKNKWDVDQINSINKPIKYIPSKGEIVGHHIDHTIEDDIMKRNQMLFEVLEDTDGNFILNTNSDGLVQCFINFENKPNRNT